MDGAEGALGGCDGVLSGGYNTGSVTPLSRPQEPVISKLTFPKRIAEPARAERMQIRLLQARSPRDYDFI